MTVTEDGVCVRGAPPDDHEHGTAPVTGTLAEVLAGVTPAASELAPGDDETAEEAAGGWPVR
jgi:hypothetical protein